MSNGFVQRVREGLERLRRADSSLKLFGASSHRYELLPPATADDLAAFETAHGVELPGAYRHFLSKLGNGGAGPYYGLFPLGLWDGSGHSLEPWGEYGAGVLKQAFPHQSRWNLPPDRLEAPDFEDDDSEDAWNDALDNEYWDRNLISGAFPICHQGCAIRDLLVVTGAQRERIWLDGRAEDQGISPERDANGHVLTFEEWYLQWLDDAIAEVGE